VLFDLFEQVMLLETNVRIWLKHVIQVVQQVHHVRTVDTVSTLPISSSVSVNQDSQE